MQSIKQSNGKMADQTEENNLRFPIFPIVNSGKLFTIDYSTAEQSMFNKTFIENHGLRSPTITFNLYRIEDDTIDLYNEIKIFICSW